MVTIIVPVYNVSKYLPDCIHSILAQDYTNLEIFLVNDGSTDDSGHICNHYAKLDSRIKVIHQENRGLSAARNAALNAERHGQYIMFVDSDDYVAPNYVSTMRASMTEHPNADMAICSYYNCCEQENGTFLPKPCHHPITKPIMSGKEIFPQRFGSMKVYYVVAWNKIYRRELFSSLRYPEGRICEDAWLSHDMYLKCSNVICLDTPLYYYRLRKDSIIGTSSVKWLSDQLEWFRRETTYFAQHDPDNFQYPAKPFVSCAYKNRRLFSKDFVRQNQACWNFSIRRLISAGSLYDKAKYLFYMLTYFIK